MKLPVTLAGAIDRPGDVDYFRFEAKAGDEIGAQVTAAELGSKLDAALVLTDAGGTVIAEGTTTLGHVIRGSGTYSLWAFATATIAAARTSRTACTSAASRW